MKSGLDDSHTKAVALVGAVQSRISEIVTEEDAKIQLIVRFVTEVLGWDHSDISTERKNDNGFSDFIISHAGRPQFLIEAKRIGELELTSSATTMQHYKISGPALKRCLEGIEQAASYCAPEGIQLAVVSDGIRWIFFRPHIPYQPYKSKEAIVFPNLDALLAEFTLFFELMSKEGIQQSLYKHIFDKIHDNRVLLTRSLRAAFGDSDIHPNQKSQIAFDLDRIFTSFFSGMSGDSDPNMLLECFVETKESRIADFALEKLTTHVLGNISPDEEVDDSLKQLIANTISDKHGETVFIVGSSGAGKSTFLKRFFQATLPKSIRDRCIVIKIDVLDATGDDASSLSWFTNEAIKQIEEQLYEKGYPDWDQLLGLYHLEYKRRSEGSDAQLYKRDKNQFKEKFGEYMNQQSEQDREGYLKRLMMDIVENRKRLPIFVVDNTDEFGVTYKETLFQYFQALRRHVTHCLLFFPCTDKSAWSFSKTELFNIYSSKSYFLPTPAPREIFRKRLEYLKGKIKPKGKTKGIYDAGNSFKIRLENVEAFASAIEDTFVLQDFASNLLGSLANFNIRKTLSLSNRVITSSAIGIEDLLKSYISGDQTPLTTTRVVQTLILGDYNFYKKGDSPELFPVFEVSPKIAQSPLLPIRILSLLKATHDARSSDDTRYLSVASIFQYFDGMGYAEIAVETSLSELLQAGLVEKHDPSATGMSIEQRIAIRHSGIAHLELALFNQTYFELMALTTLITNSGIAEEIRLQYLSNDPLPLKMKRVRQTFASFLLDEDAHFGRVPSSDQYAVQEAVTADIRKFSSGESQTELANRDGVITSSQLGVIAEAQVATVDWFDSAKNYGFVILDGSGESAFLHSSVLEKCSVTEVRDGDPVLVDISRSHKGIAVSKISKLKKRKRISATGVEAVVVKMYHSRGYGFVYVPALEQEAFFHSSLLPESQRDDLGEGTAFLAEINEDPKGRGLQVRRILKPR